MNAKKSALGKGLGALIPEIKDIDNEEIKNTIREIEINKIIPNEDQPRKNFDEDKLIKLSESIANHGIIQPIIVKKKNEFYQIVAGERRWRAAKIAGVKLIPIIEKELTDKEEVEVSLIENLQREDLNPIEEAIAYKRLIDEYRFTQEEISIRIGKSRPAIANSLRLLNLDKRVLEYLVDGTLSEGHGRVIVSIEDKELQYEIAKKIIDESYNVRQTESLVRNLEKGNEKKEKKKTVKEIYIKDLEERLKFTLGTKVNINNGKNKGKIEIEYYSNDDLQRIIELLGLEKEI